MKQPIIVPDQIMPKPMTWRNCECMKQPVDLAAKKRNIDMAYGDRRDP